MFSKPSKYYDICSENDLLKFSTTREALTSLTLGVLWVWLLHLMILAASAFLLGPITKPAWQLILFLGGVGTLGAVALLYLSWEGRECVFDRTRNRISCGRKILGKVHDILHVCLYQEEGQDRKLRYVLSLALTGQKPCRLCLQETPEELRMLANAIAEYARVPVSAVDPLGPNAEYNRARFQKVDWRMSGWLFLFFILGGIGWLAVLIGLGHWRAAMLMEAAYVVAPSILTWVVPAMFLGILTGSAVLDRFQQYSLKDAYADYVRYQERKHGLTKKAVQYLFFWPTLVLSVSFTVMVLDWYVIFTDREIVINPFFGFSEEHRPYASIARIKTAREFVAPNGSRTGCREFVIFFSDGAHWSTHTEPSRMTEPKKRDLMEFVSAKSRVPIEEIEVFSNDEVS